MTAYSLTGMTTLGTVTKCVTTKDSGLFEQALPASDSSEQILIDLFGCTRKISLEGTFVSGQGGKTVTQFIEELNALQTGNQATSTFVSGQNGVPYNVYIVSVEYSDDEANPNSVDYRIEMSEGS
jgi:hypothetical protein